jgi:hypothetical protein
MINNNNNILPYFKKDMSTLLTMSTAAIALLAISPLVLSPFLQPVQATLLDTNVQTPNPIALGSNCNVGNADITFNAQGSQTSPDSVTLTSGTFQVTNSSSSGQILWSGDFNSGSISEYDGNTQDYNVEIVYNVDNRSLVCGAGEQLRVNTYCHQGQPPSPNIVLETNGKAIGGVNGAVDCGTSGDTTTAQPTSTSPVTGTTTTTTTTTTQQDRDGDRILDANDNCPNSPNTRCYKEGDTAVVVHNNSNR